MKKIILIVMLGIFCLTIHSKETDPKNIIIISVDTLRADHLSCNGYPIKTSPEIDKFSKDSIRFSNCFTVTPLTAPAFSSMLTSLPPHKHGAKRNGLSVFSHIHTLPWHLKKYGYTSSAFISNWPLRKKLSQLHKDFDSYYEIFTRKRYHGLFNDESTAVDVNLKVEKWLDENYKKKMFLWIHYSDPHAKYIFHTKYNFEYKKENKSYYPPKTRFKKIRKYDSEIAFTDFHIGLLIKKLKKLNLYNDSLIIFISDHGESFGEHKYFKHGKKLFNSTLHVPLIVKLPNNRLKNTVIDNNVSILDISPTILSVLNLPIPENMEGTSIFEKNRGKPIFFETYKGTVLFRRSNIKFHNKVHPIKHGILLGNSKIIHSRKSGELKIFNIKNDIFELQDLYVKNSNEYKKLKLLLVNYVKSINKYIKYSRKYFKQNSKLSQEDIQKLKSLGYID